MCVKGVIHTRRLSFIYNLSCKGTVAETECDWMKKCWKALHYDPLTSEISFLLLYYFIIFASVSLFLVP